MKKFNFENIRDDFTILSRKIYNKELVYLDSAASAQKPNSVINAMKHAMEHYYSNVHRGIYKLSNESTKAYEDCRTEVQKFIGANSSDEIIFTKNATEAINLVAYSWAMENLQKGDEIIISMLEHHANIVPWHFLRQRMGIVLHFTQLNPDGSFNIESYKKLFNEKTKLVAITHMSNVTGEVLPVEELSKIAHNHNVPILIDGSQAIVHNDINVQKIDADWYVFTGHKLYASSGIGVLYSKSSILNNMRPFLGGGEMIDYVTQDTISYNVPPFRFEAGTPPIIEAISLKSAIDYLNQFDRTALYKYEIMLGKYLYEKLSQVEGIKIYGSPNNISTICSFNIENIHSHDLCTYLDRQGVELRGGTHCAQPLLSSFKISDCARASIAIYNRKQDIDKLVESLNKARIFFNGK